MSELELNPRYTEAVAILVNESPYFSLLSMEIKDLQWGTCLMEVELGEKHLQPFGNVHGGAIASLVDATTLQGRFPPGGKRERANHCGDEAQLPCPCSKGETRGSRPMYKWGETLALGEASVGVWDRNGL